MKLGVFTTLDKTKNSSMKDWLELLNSCESMGYNSIWLAELHFNQSSLSSTPALMLANLAAKTTKIKLGYGVKLLAFHHPFLIAEELSTLQNLSNNRIIFGVGKGTPLFKQENIFGLVKCDLRDNMYKSLDIIESFWNKNKVSFRDINQMDLQLSPEPIFDFPQTVIATFATQESIENIIESNNSLMFGSPFLVEELHESIERVNKQIPPLYLTRFCAIDKDHKKARRLAEPFIKRWVDKVKHGGVISDLEDKVDSIINTSLIGDKIFCREQLARYKELLNPIEILAEPIDSNMEEKRSTLEYLASL